MNRNLSVAVNWSVVGVDLRQFAGELARIQVAWLNMKWGSMCTRQKAGAIFQTFPPNVFFLCRERVRSNYQLVFLLIVGCWVGLG